MQAEKREAAAREKEETLFRSMEMLYKDYVNGKISEDVHKRLLDDYQAQYQTVKEQIEQLERNQDPAAEIKSSYESFFALVESYNHIDTLTAEIVRTFISRIEVGEKQLPPGYQIASHTNTPYKQEIIIYFRFIGAANTMQIGA